MIITDKYVFLHYPKAGGTFVTKMLRNLYFDDVIPSYEKSLFKKILKSKPYFNDLENQSLFEGVIDGMKIHGGYFQIPVDQRKKEIFTFIRNPFDFYVSFFETRKWENRWIANNESVLTRFPNFPNLKFDEFLLFLNNYYVPIMFPKMMNGIKIEGVGLYTLMLILMYSETPLVDYKKLADSNSDILTFESFNFRKEITYLSFDNLNTNLFNFLSKYHFKNQLQMIHSSKRENVTASKVKDYKEYYSEETYEQVRQVDRWGFIAINKLLK